MRVGRIYSRRLWTDEETSRAAEIFREYFRGHNKRGICQLIATELGRSLLSVENRLINYGPDFRKRPDENGSEYAAGTYNRPPEDVMQEREYRSRLEHQTLTAAICGDPLPGYSALDRMQRTAHRR